MAEKIPVETGLDPILEHQLVAQNDTAKGVEALIVQAHKQNPIPALETIAVKSSDIEKQQKETNGHLKDMKEVFTQDDVMKSVIGAFLKAVKGEQGDKGDTGEKGEHGNDGKDGKDGEQGIQGFTGKDGADGKNGRDGLDGYDGKDGHDGKDGKDGTNGRDGTEITPSQIREMMTRFDDSEKLSFSDLRDANDILNQIRLMASKAGGSGYMHEIADVSFTSLTDGDVLTYVAATNKWINKAPSGGSVSPLTTKGDLYVFSTINTRLAVGPNGYVLMADSAQATGLRWAALAGGGDMLQATYDPAGVAEQLVGLTATQTLTHKNLTSATNTFPTFNQTTTGSAAKWTTPRLLAGNSVDGSADVPFANKFIVQGTADAGLTNAQFLGSLATGIIKNTTSTGVLSIAVAGTDYLVPNSPITGATHTKITYDASGRVTAGTDATTSDIAEGSNLYYTNARVLAALLTGYTSGAGTISSSDSVLSAIQKLNGNIAALGSAVSSVSGTANRVTSTGGTTPVIDISATFEALLGKVASPLSQFASTTSAQLASIMSDETGSGPLVFGTSPTVSLASASTAVTQSPGDGSTKLATTAYVDAAINGTDAKDACKYASTAALPSIIYANGSSGVGATLTGVALAAISLDSSSPSVGDRVLIKNQVSTFQNGIYTVTATGSGIAVFVLTRTSDFDQSADIDIGDSVFITAGTVNINTTWVQNGTQNPVMGTDPITFSQIAGPGAITSGNGIAVTGNSVAIDTSVTVDKTTAQTLSNKTLTSPTLTTPALGTPSAINLTNANYVGLIEEIDFVDAGTSIAAQTYTLTCYAIYGFTIETLHIIAGAGSCTAAIKINGTNVTSLSAVAVTTTISNTNSSGAKTVVAGDIITLVITSPTSLNNLQASLKTIRT